MDTCSWVRRGKTRCLLIIYIYMKHCMSLILLYKYIWITRKCFFYILWLYMPEIYSFHSRWVGCLLICYMILKIKHEHGWCFIFTTHNSCFGFAHTACKEANLYPLNHPSGLSIFRFPPLTSSWITVRACLCCSVVLLDPEEKRRKVSSTEGWRQNRTGHHPVTHGNAISCSGRSSMFHCVWIGQEQVFWGSI